MEKQSMEVLLSLYENFELMEYSRVSGKEYHESSIDNLINSNNRFHVQRLEIVRHVLNKLEKLKKEKERNDLIKKGLLHIGKNKGKELLNVFINKELLKNKESSKKLTKNIKKLRKFLKKVGERTGNKFKYPYIEMEFRMNELFDNIK